MYNGILIAFAVLYVISPVPLAIACIILGSSRARLRRELEEERRLRRQQGTPAGTPEKISPPAEPPAEPLTQPLTQPPAQPDPQPAGQPPLTASQPVTPQPAAGQPEAARPVASRPQANTAAKTRRPAVSPVTVIFVIGSLFIVAAGVLFAGSTWHYLSDLQRAGVLFSLSVLFFIASTLADRLFGLKHTGSAFYILAAVFVPVTVLAAGWFSLFGANLSLTGSDRFLLGALASALFTVCAVYGTFRFNLAALAWAALCSLSATLALVAVQLSATLDYALLVMALWSALLVGLSALLDHPRVRTLPAAQSLLLRPLHPFSLLHLCAAATAAIAGYQGSPVFLVSIAITGLLFMTPKFNDARYRTGGTGIFPFTLCLVIALIRAPGTEMTTSLVSASAVVMLIGFSGLTGPAVRARSTIAALLVLAVALFTLVDDTFIWSLPLLLASLVLTIAASLRLGGPERIYRYLHPLLLIITLYGAVNLAPRAHGLPWIAAAVLCALCVLLYDRFSLRSAFSDTVLHLAVFGIWLYSLDELALVHSLTVIAVMTLMTILSSRRSTVFRWIAPHYFVLVFASLGVDEDSWQIPALALYAAMTATGSALLAAVSIKRFADMRPELDKWIAAFRLPMILWGCAAAGAQLADPAGTLLPWFTGLALLWCLGEYRAARSKLPAWTFCSGLFMLFALALARRILTALELPLEWTLYGGAAAAALTGLFTHAVFPLRARMEMTILRTVSLAALQILSAVIILVYLGNEELPLGYGLAAVPAVLAGWLAGYYGRLSMTAIAPFLLLFPLLTALAEHSGGGQTAVNQAYTILFAGALGASFLFYRGCTCSRFTRGTHLDSFAITAALAAAYLVVRGFDIPDRNNLYWQFYGYLMLSAASLACLRGTGSRLFGSPAVSIAALPLAAAIVTQPFIAIPAVMLTEYRLVVPLIFALLLHKLVWKKNQSIGWLIFVYGFGTLIRLGYEALTSGEALDALFLGAASVISFLVSFKTRIKRLFILSSVTLIFLGVYMSREFWMSIAWWLYLLITGILFIAIAVTNEAFKKRGENLGTKIGNLFSEWRW